MQTINTALLSFGMSGQVFHAPFLKVHEGFNFYAVWERSKNLAQEKYPGVKIYRTLDELLADEAIELVIVNTPSITHYEYTKKCLQANKNVVVEKPFTATVPEAEELGALAKAKNKMLSVYHNRRYDSDYLTVKKVVEENLLGDLIEAEFHYDRYTPELSYKVHKETPTPGVGIVYDLGSHLIDQALLLFGMPHSVFADIDTARPQSKVDDYVELLMFYSGFRVRIHSSLLVREQLPAYILHGKKGSFIKSKADVQEVELQAGKIPGATGWGREPENEKGVLYTEMDGLVTKEQIPSLPGNYMLFYEGIYKALREQQPAPVTAQEGLNVIRIIAAAYESSRNKTVVKI